MSSVPWRKVLVTAIATVVLLEVVLQIGAVVVWMRSSPAAEELGTGPVVACVGDSFTFGVGASSTTEASYPSALERELRSKYGMGDVRVANFGKPGRNSAELLAELDGMIAASGPDVVCVLIGTNDRWTRPKPIVLGPIPPKQEATDDGTGFRLRWRTKRLFDLAILNLFERGNPGDDDAVEEDEGAEVAESNEAKPAAPQPIVSRPPSVPKPPPSDASANDIRRHADRLVSGGHAAEAVRFLGEQVERDLPNRLELRALFTRALKATGDADAARAQLEFLREAHASEPTRRTVRSVLEAMSYLGAEDAALELAMASTEEFGDVPTVWLTIGRIHQIRGEDREAEVAYERALELIPADQSPGWRASAMCQYARVMLSRDPRAAFGVVLDAFELQPRPASATVILQLGKETLPRETMDEIMAGRDVSAKAREAIEEVIEAVHGAKAEAYLETLQTHLVQIVERVRAHGAHPVLLTYPRAVKNRTMATHLRVGEITGAPVVPIDDRFKRELKTRDRDELFVPDNHCNDAGYAIMGEMVAIEVAKILREIEQAASEQPR